MRCSAPARCRRRWRVPRGPIRPVGTDLLGAVVPPIGHDQLVRRRVLLGALGRLSFSLLWTGLALLLSPPVCQLDEAAIGLLGSVAWWRSQMGQLLGVVTIGPLGAGVQARPLAHQSALLTFRTEASAASSPSPRCRGGTRWQRHDPPRGRSDPRPGGCVQGAISLVAAGRGVSGTSGRMGRSFPRGARRAELEYSFRGDLLGVREFLELLSEIGVACSGRASEKIPRLLSRGGVRVRCHRDDNEGRRISLRAEGSAALRWCWVTGESGNPLRGCPAAKVSPCGEALCAGVQVPGGFLSSG